MTSTVVDDEMMEDYNRMMLGFEELAGITKEFEEVLGLERSYLIDEPEWEEEAENPFLEDTVSFEDDILYEDGRNSRGVRTSATTGLGVVKEGLGNKINDKRKELMERSGEYAARGALATGKGIVGLAKAFMRKLTSFMNRVATATGKLLKTMRPLMGKIISDADKLRDKAKNASSVNDSTIKVRGANKYLVIDGKLVSPDKLIGELDRINEMQQILLDKDKLKKFEEFSNSIFEPYRETITKNKVDSLVFAMAVIGAVTNPGVAVGTLLRGVFVATGSNGGAAVDKAVRIAGAATTGALTGGLGWLAMAMGGAASPILKELQNGKMDVSMIPKFRELYPFCDKQEEIKGGLYVKHVCRPILGDRFWSQIDYAEELTSYTQGSVHNLGAKFESLKNKSKDSEVKPLRPDQVVKICDMIALIMRNAQGYCDSWPKYSDAYMAQYEKISDIVMSYNPDADKAEGKKSIVGRYVRYSYRNSMNIMLGSIWNNCFSSDNQFIRYMVFLSKVLLRYGKESITMSKVKSDFKEETDSSDEIEANQP